MITWDYFDWGKNIDRGLTNNGFPFCKVDILGWNDNQNYSDLENLISIQAIHTYSSIEVKVTYLHPDARNNFTARKLAESAKAYLVESIKK